MPFDNLFPSWLPGWAVDIIMAFLGPIVDLITGLLGITTSIAEWLSNLLGNVFGLVALLETAIADYFASKYPLYQFEDPFPILPASGGLIPVKIPIRNLAATIDSQEMIVHSECGCIAMKMTFDQNLFTQIGLDSGALTMLGGVTHRFLEAGQYRGVVYRGGESIGKFYINVDKNSPVAQANIDLAAFDANPPATSATTTGTTCGCQAAGSSSETTFEVNPKGYAVFHVSSGAGGYAVRASKAVEDPKQQNQFDSRELKCEDIFSAVILRPGTYSASNGLNAKAKGKITVSYPKIGKTAYRPPSPAKVICSEAVLSPPTWNCNPARRCCSRRMRRLASLSSW